MMQQMYERISGYDYQCEVDSNVTKCSFGSYKEICTNNPLLKLYQDDEADIENSKKKKKDSDKATFWRNRRLMLLVLEELFMNKLKRQNRRGLRD